MSGDYLPAHPVAAADQLRSLASDLEVQEERIERGVQAFTDIGSALAKIRDEKLYRHEYATFEAYCLSRWQLSRPRAYQLIDAATITEAMEAALEMSTNVDIPLPSNEAQARALVGLSPEAAISVMQEAAEATNGRPTADAIRNARDDHTTIDAATGELLSETPLPQPAPKPVWSEEELALRKRLENGETVVVSMKGGIHANLIAWADSKGLYVRIDRNTVWGNPFVIGDDGDRDDVIAKYSDCYLPHKNRLQERLPELVGSALGCWCAPEPCHGDILKKAAER